MKNQNTIPPDPNEIKNAISDLYEECLNRQPSFHRKVDLFIIPNHLAKQVLEKTGLDVYGHWVCIDNYGIIHTLEQHGNPLSEARRGQIAVEKEDILGYLDVFLAPDEIQLAGHTKRTKLPLLQFVKIVGNKKIVVKEVRTVVSTKKQKVCRLVFHTMYKIKVSK